MGCFGRDKHKYVKEEQRWDYITLTDFDSSSTLTKLSYAWLWVLSAIAIAVYVADTFTAVNLLAFNKWSSQVDPAIDIKISKWIFTGCILFSWALAIFEWLRALRVIRGGGVADSYLDPLAATIQSSRLYKGGHGWRRFLVFAELTKSKKGVDYIALFVYFSFKGAIRIILAEGPRQVVNAVTLWAVMKAKLIPEGKNAATGDNTSLEQFWVNVELLANENKEQAVIYSTMTFTLVIWVISALSLIIAAVLYVLFLWHFIPSIDGTLQNYCRRKVDKRLDRIVGVKVQKAIEKQEKKIREEEEQAIRAAEKAARKLESGHGSQKSGVLQSQKPRPVVPRKPTLPQLGGLDRTDTQSSVSTLPAYSSQPPSRPSTSNSTRPAPQRIPTLPHISEDDRRPGPIRTDTASSGWSAKSYGSNAPLLGAAGDMGESTPPPMPPMPTGFERSLTNGPQQRSYTPMGQPPQGRGTPGPMGPNGYGPPPRSNTAFSAGQPPRSNTAFSAGQPPRSYTPMDMPPMQGRNSPAVGPNGYGSNGYGSNGYGPNGYGPNGYGPNGYGPNGYPPRGAPGPGPMRQNTGYDMNDGYNMPPPPGPLRTNTGMTNMSRGTAGPSPLGNADFGPWGRSSPAPPMQMSGQAYEMQYQQRQSPVEQRPSPVNARSNYDLNGGYAGGPGDYDPFRAETPIQRPIPAATMHRARSPSSASTQSASTSFTQHTQGSYLAFKPQQNAPTSDPESMRAANVTPINTQQQEGYSPVDQDRYVSPVYERNNQSQEHAGSPASQERHVSPVYERASSHSHSSSQSRNFSAPMQSAQEDVPRRLQRSATEPMQPPEQADQGQQEQRPSTAGGRNGREPSPENWRRDAYGFGGR